MAYFTKEDIERASQMDLLTYLKSCEPSELVHIHGEDYCTREHDSLKISNGKWMWWSRADEIRKKSGFERRYLRCLYEMGYLPKYIQRPERVHRIFKDELLRCEMYSREARFLCDNHIVTDQDLLKYTKEIEGRMYSMSSQREELRREAKRNIPQEKREAVKKEISILTDKLRKYRSDLKLCEDIKARSGMLEDKLTAIDKEKTRGKETI